MPIYIVWGKPVKKKIPMIFRMVEKEYYPDAKLTSKHILYMSKKLTQQQMLAEVMNDESMTDAFLKELSQRGFSSGLRINNKKVSIQTYNNTRKMAAQSVYETFKKGK